MNYQSIYGKDVRVDPDASEDSVDRKFPDIEYKPEIITDIDKYHSVEAMRREWEMLWSKTWNLAGRVSDLKVAGDYINFELGPESFIITRTKNNDIAAFYNVCHHRGSRIVRDAFGNVSAFTCPFHSWTWNLDGSLRRITDRETFDETVVSDNPSLTPVRCEVWGGFIFINMDENAEPLSSYLAEFSEIMEAYEMENMHVLSDMETDWPVNWKTVLDAFMEGYHAHQRHPELLRYIDDYHFQHDLWGNGHSRMIIPIGLKTPRFGDQNQLSEELKEIALSFDLDPAEFEGRASDIRAMLPEAKRKWAKKLGFDFSAFTDSQLSDDWNVSLFPNITFNTHPEGVLVMRFRPHAKDPERCFYDVWVLGYKHDDTSYQMPSYMPVQDQNALRTQSPRPERIYAKYGEASFGLVLDQDGETVPLVQQGMHSKAFKGQRLSQQEIRIVHMYKEYERYLSGEK